MARRNRRPKRGGIPRVDLQARRATTTLDARNRPTTESFVAITAESCTVQPATGAQLETLPEGMRDAEAFSIFTDTNLRTAIRGTNNQADEVFLGDPYTASPGYFTVINSKAWQNGVISHFHVLVVRKNI